MNATTTMERPAVAEVLELEPAPTHQLAPATAPAATAIVNVPPSKLLELAIQSNANIETLERLMALQERWEANEARRAYVEAMAAFKAEPMTIFKRKAVNFTTRDNDVVSYKHAELSDITEVVCPAMSKHGLSHRWNVSQAGDVITVDCIVTHRLGHSEKVTMQGKPDASGKKNPIQQVASTVQYLQRYTLLAATGMSTKGTDDDGNGGPDSEGLGADEEALLDQFREAALDGEQALRKFYDKNVPTEDFWKKYQRELKETAKRIDRERGAGQPGARK